MFEEMQEFFAEYTKGSVSSIAGLIRETSNILSDNFFFDNGATVWNLVNGLADKLKPICYIIIVIAMLYELINTAVKLDQIKWEYAIKTLVKLVIAKVAIDEGTKILTCIYLTSVEWVASFGQGLDVTGIALIEYFLENSFALVMKDVTEWESLAMMTSVSIVMLLLKFCDIIVKIMAYARMFELCVLVALAPIPFAFLPLSSSGGVNRITLRYIKNFSAVALQAVVIMVSLRVYQILFLGDFLSKLQDIVNLGTNEPIKILEMCFIMILKSLILIMAIVKSGSWAKQIMDAA